jgi:hypothetical protein
MVMALLIYSQNGDHRDEVTMMSIMTVMLDIRIISFRCHDRMQHYEHYFKPRVKMVILTVLMMLLMSEYRYYE